MKLTIKTIITLLSLCLAVRAYPPTATPLVRPTANDMNPVPTYARSVVPVSSPQPEKGRYVTTVEPVVPLSTTVLPGPLVTDFKPITEGESNTMHSAVTIRPVLESDSTPAQPIGGSVTISPVPERDSPSGVAGAMTKTISAHTVKAGKGHRHGKKHSAVSEEILNAQANTEAHRVHKHAKHALTVAAGDVGKVVNAAGGVKHIGGNLRKAKKHMKSAMNTALPKAIKKAKDNMVVAGVIPIA